MSGSEHKCRWCGKTCGNAGALSRHEDACDERPQDQRPARRTQAADAQPPASGELAETATSMAAIADGDLPTRNRLGALQTLLQKGSQMLEGYQNYRREKLARQEDRAANLEIEEPEMAVSCPTCGYDILPHEIPLQADVMRCPGGCGRALKLADRRRTEA